MMGRSAVIDLKEWRAFREQLFDLPEKKIPEFMESATKDIASRVHRAAKKRTPVGVHPAESGKKGGTLRRNWKTGVLEVDRKDYSIDVTNTTNYASFVEFGHRGVFVPDLGVTLHTDTHWTDGQFMLTFAVKDVEAMTIRVLKSKLNKFTKEVFGDD